MADRENFWAVNYEDKWAVKGEGGDEIVSEHETQEEAWDEARRLAKESSGEAIMQASDGTIRKRSTYGDDPYQVPGSLDGM